MAGLRTLSVFFIALLLLGVVIENSLDKKKLPLLLIVNDNSESITIKGDSAYYKQQFIPQLHALSSTLDKKFDIVKYSFSDRVYPSLNDRYEGKATDISRLFYQLFEQYTHRNVGGLILATDGKYNSGSNPIYTIEQKGFFPIFTVGLGDTTQVRDVQVDAVQHNDIAFLGNRFPVEVSFSQTQCDGEKSVVRIYRGDEMIAQENTTFSKDKQHQTIRFELKAANAGLQKYTVKIAPVKREFTLKNNYTHFYIEVIDGRQKILLTHNGPHPDVSAIRYVIENNKNYEVTVQSLNKVESVKKYDLIIAHNYNSTNSAVEKAIKGGEVPFLLIVGNQTTISSMTDAKLGVSGRKTATEDVGFQHNTAFKEIVLSPQIAVQFLSNAPPLQVPFGDLNFSKAIDILAYQKLGSIALEQPLIYFSQRSGTRMGVIMGEGIWRWRLYDQFRHQSTAYFEAFVRKIITFLALKSNKDPFKVDVKNEYRESESVVVEAVLYNSSYERINEPEVVFAYQREGGSRFQPHFMRKEDAYELQLGRLGEGIYNWKATTDFQGKHYEKKGTFLVRETKQELLDIRADHQLLRNIAQRSNGRFYFPEQLRQLERDLLNREDMVTVVYQEKSHDHLIDYQILFVLITALTTAEWFLRKYHGAY